MIKIVVFIPESHKEKVKQAMFDLGGGQIGSYDRCSFEVKGQGQFRPLKDAHPYLGRQGDVETVSEYRVEMVCQDAKVPQVLQAMKETHPYETPAFDVIKLVDC